MTSPKAGASPGVPQATIRRCSDEEADAQRHRSIEAESGPLADRDRHIQRGELDINKRQREH
jgi:hypothetical protein